LDTPPLPKRLVVIGPDQDLHANVRYIALSLLTLSPYVLILFWSSSRLPGHGGESLAHKTMAEPNPETPDPLDVALEQAVAICDGDVRAALRAALVANSFLTAEVERLTAEVERLTRAVSFGFLRKRLPARREREARRVA
jgi:hypothetical protein